MIADRFLEKNEKSLREMLFNSSDFKSSDFRAGDKSYRLFYLDSMIEYAIVQEHIISPLLHNNTKLSVREAVSILDYSETNLLSIASNALVGGKTVVQIEGEAKFYLLGAELIKERNVTIPLNERVLRGSHKALNESLNTNLNLIRNLVATPDLVVKFHQLGRRTNTKVAVLYLNSLVNKEILNEFNRRIEKIDIDYIEAPGFVKELIDKKFSLFPKMLITERPDRVRSNLMDGKIAILTDGSPDCIILPVSFWAFFQSSEDYQSHWLLGSVLRFLRVVCFVLSIILPGAYVALVTFDPRIVPFEIALTLQSSMQYIAMPPILEAFSMLAILEILREATVRLPSSIGQTIGVVGGIVIGTVVVQSNLISNMMVVVVALTGVASFIIPSYEMSSAARLLTYPFIVMASIFGLIGLEIASLLLITHLSRINTMGIPYFYTWFDADAIKDTIFRAPIFSMKKRPKESMVENETRIKTPRE